MSLRRAFPFLLASLLAACSSGEDISEPYLEANAPAGQERIPVLTFEQAVEPDPALADIRVVLPRPYANIAWPQSGGTAGNVVHHLALPDVLERDWSRNIGKGSDLVSRLITAPVVSDDRIFALDTRGRLSALRTSDGREIWRVRLKFERGAADEGFLAKMFGSIFGSAADKRVLAGGGGMAVAVDKLIVATGFGYVTARDVATGEEVWRYDGLIPLRGAPTVLDGRIFVVTHDNQILALDLETGEMLWTAAGIPEDAGIFGAAAPAVAGDTVIAALSSGELLALRVENGNQTWQDTLSRTRRLTPLATLADIDGNPVIDRGRVYAVGHVGRMVAIDIRSGERVWENNVAGLHTPWLAGDYIFAVSVDNELVAVNAADGRIRWVTRLQRFADIEEREDAIVWVGPVLAGDRLIVASSHGYLVSVSPYTGEFLGARRVGAGVSAVPVVADNSLYILTDDAELMAFR